MWQEENIERLLKEDNMEKRKANGARYNSGRRGSSLKGIKGSLHMPSDVLKYTDKQEYKLYTRGGEVVETNFYSEISNLPTLTEIKAKDFKSAQNIMRVAKSSHKLKDLIKHWDTSSGSLYALFDKYEIEYPKRQKKEKTNEDVKNNKNKGKTRGQYKTREKANFLPQAPAWDGKKSELIEEQKRIFEESKLEQENIPKNVTVIEDDEVLHLRYSPKQATGEQIQTNIVNYVSILEKEKRYSVKLIISELP